ncbi:hypothetical protein NDU88_005665 [Pleurodeles waltl]|uniref:Fructose-2,6-bisphosphatase TIGAR n=1 Tax=Pleurodeles waltl TaxID=8319 RepID=A0AAV7SMB8_PLEWA|nr:hypothetical protein NDU88_005665 [Pleurodeles waltl]
MIDVERKSSISNQTALQRTNEQLLSAANGEQVNMYTRPPAYMQSLHWQGSSSGTTLSSGLQCDRNLRSRQTASTAGGCGSEVFGLFRGIMVRFAVTLVRHGETRYNKERLLQGQGIDEPLSEMGFRQANAAGRFLNGVRFTHVFSSDLIRAKQTAATILGESRMCKDHKINLDARLRERKYGVAEGKPLSELKTRAKAAGQQCPKYTPPGGETLEEVKARAKDFFEFLCQLALEEKCVGGEAGLETGNGFVSYTATTFSSENHGSAPDFDPDAGSDDIMLDASILVVSHGAFLRIWIKYFLDDLQCAVPSTLKRSRELSVSPNTGISHFIVKLEREETVKPQITCVCINRHDHLLEVEPGADV